MPPPTLIVRVNKLTFVFIDLTDKMHFIFKIRPRKTSLMFHVVLLLKCIQHFFYKVFLKNSKQG